MFFVEGVFFLQKSKDATELQILEEFAELRSLLEDKKRHMLSSLHEHFRLKIGEVVECSESVKSTLQSTHAVLSLCTEAMREQDQTAFLQVHC